MQGDVCRYRDAAWSVTGEREAKAGLGCAGESEG